MGEDRTIEVLHEAIDGFYVRTYVRSIPMYCTHVFIQSFEESFVLNDLF